MHLPESQSLLSLAGTGGREGAAQQTGIQLGKKLTEAVITMEYSDCMVRYMSDGERHKLLETEAIFVVLLKGAVSLKLSQPLTEGKAKQSASPPILQNEFLLAPFSSSSPSQSLALDRDGSPVTLPESKEGHGSCSSLSPTLAPCLQEGHKGLRGQPCWHQGWSC